MCIAERNCQDYYDSDFREHRPAEAHILYGGGSDGDSGFLHAGDGAQLAQQVYIIRMVRPQIAARRRKQALPVLAGPVRQLFFAGGLAEIGRRAADVMDVALEVGMLRHARRLGQQRVMAARLDDAALVEGQGAEAAAAEAAPVGDQAEFDLLQRRDAP